MELSFLMIRRTKFPWRHAATAYLRRGACARIHFSVYIRGQRVRLHTLKPFRRASAVTSCPISVSARAHRRVYTLALGPPWPILLLFLDNGCIYTLILDYTADLQEGFYKGLAQADSHLNTPDQRAKDCRPSAFVLSGATNACDTSKLTGTGTYHSQYLCLQCVL